MKKNILVISISLMHYSNSANQSQLHNRNIKLKRHFKDKFRNAEVTACCEHGKVMYKGSF